MFLAKAWRGIIDVFERSWNGIIKVSKSSELLLKTHVNSQHNATHITNKSAIMQWFKDSKSAAAVFIFRNTPPNNSPVTSKQKIDRFNLDYNSNSRQQRLSLSSELDESVLRSFEFLRL